MKRSSFMLSLLILSPTSSGNDIDVYLQPLVEELKKLWDVEVKTFDVSSKKSFQIHATLLWTINNFLAYGDISDWSTKSALACNSWIVIINSLSKNNHLMSMLMQDQLLLRYPEGKSCYKRML